MCLVGIIICIWPLLFIYLQFTWIQLLCHLLNQKQNKICVGGIVVSIAAFQKQNKTKKNKGSLKLEAVNYFNQVRAE